MRFLMKKGRIVHELCILLATGMTAFVSASESTNARQMTPRLSFLRTELRKVPNSIVNVSPQASQFSMSPEFLFSFEPTIRLEVFASAITERQQDHFIPHDCDGMLIGSWTRRGLSWICQARYGYPPLAVFQNESISVWLYPYPFAHPEHRAWADAANILATGFRKHPDWTDRIAFWMPPPFESVSVSEGGVSSYSKRLWAAAHAIEHDEVEELRNLLSGRLTPDDTFAWRVGLLTHAAVLNATNCVELLLEHGADPLRLDGFGRTPREEALLHGAVEAAAMLPERPIPEDSP